MKDGQWRPQKVLAREEADDDGQAREALGVDDPQIQHLIAVPSIRKGGRSDAILKVLNAAGKSGWTNHQILELGSELATRWDVRSPEKNLYEHWRYLFGMLRNVRSHYPAPGKE